MERGNHQLQESEFWRKKFHRYMVVRDANKDGRIDRADYRLVVQRYKDLNVSAEHLKKISSAFGKAYDELGIVDDDTSLTYDEFASRFAERKSTMNKIGDDIFSSMFEAIDADGNGEISFKEWVLYYKGLGIDTAYARASFDAMDANSDGIISAKEFINYNKEYMLSTKDTLKSSILYGPLK
jgi:Ca2+-binding EF-hand superfamily protein